MLRVSAERGCIVPRVCRNPPLNPGGVTRYVVPAVVLPMGRHHRTHCSGRFSRRIRDADGFRWPLCCLDRERRSESPPKSAKRTSTGRATRCSHTDVLLSRGIGQPQRYRGRRRARLVVFGRGPRVRSSGSRRCPARNPRWHCGSCSDPGPASRTSLGGPHLPGALLGGHPVRQTLPGSIPCRSCCIWRHSGVRWGSTRVDSARSAVQCVTHHL